MKNQQREQYRDQSLPNAIEGFVFIDIDTNIDEFSLSKHYKWITSLELISSEDFQERIFIKSRDVKSEQQVLKRYLKIDKWLYLVANFCEDSKLPISRVRMMKYSSANQDWTPVTYPKCLEHLYSYSICYQLLQSKECKRIITDIEICQGKEIQTVSRGNDWEICKVPEIDLPLSFKMQGSNEKSSTQDNRTTQSVEGEEKKGSIENQNQSDRMVKTDEGFEKGVQNKLSDRSWMKENSNLSENSYYSCNEKSSNVSIEKQVFSDIDELQSPSTSKERQSFKSSLTEFHSMEQDIVGPLYFLMKTVDLYECHNQFQYAYQPMIKEIVKNPGSCIQDQNLMPLSKFCFPNGIKLSKKIEGCGYEIFNLVLTTAEGERYYTYVLKYKEVMSHYLENKLMDELLELKLIEKSEIKRNRKIISQKAICIVTKVQNTDPFVKILEHLYRVYLSFKDNINNEYFTNKGKSKNQKKASSEEYPKGIQYFARHLVEYFKEFQKNSNIPVAPGSFWKMPLTEIPTLNEIEERKKNFKWCGTSLHLPLRKNFKQQNIASSKAMFCLMKLLSVDNIASLLLSLLLEKKIFIVSNVQTNIGYVVEAALGLIFPLRWSHTVIPIVCGEMIDLIDAPFPMIAGLREEDAGEKTLSKGVHVFLDCNQVLSSEELPRHPECFSILKKKLKEHELYHPEHVEQLLNYKEQIYSFNIREKTQFSEDANIQTQNLLLSCMINVLMDYDDFYSKQAKEYMAERASEKEQRTTLSPVLQSKEKGIFPQALSSKSSLPTNSEQALSLKSTSVGSVSSKRKHFTFNKIYQSVSFVMSHSKKEHPFYREFVETSAFKNLVQTNFHTPQNEQILFINEELQKIDENFSNSLSCLSIPLSKKISPMNYSDGLSQFATDGHIKNLKTKVKQSIQNRISFTNTKPGVMRKNKSNKQDGGQSTIKKSGSKKVENSQIRSKALFPGTEKGKKDEEQVFPQRYSEGGPHREPQFHSVMPEQNVPEGLSEPKSNRSSVGQNICAMVENMTRKISESRQNISGLFSEAKVQRLKNLSKQENRHGRSQGKLQKQTNTKDLSLKKPPVSKKMKLEEQEEQSKTRLKNI